MSFLSAICFAIHLPGTCFAHRREAMSFLSAICFAIHLPGTCFDLLCNSPAGDMFRASARSHVFPLGDLLCNSPAGDMFRASARSHVLCLSSRRFALQFTCRGHVSRIGAKPCLTIESCFPVLLSPGVTAQKEHQNSPGRASKEENFPSGPGNQSPPWHREIKQWGKSCPAYVPGAPRRAR